MACTVFLPAADMLHPSEVAVDYIFNAFSNAFFDKNTLQCMHEINQYQNGISHRPIHTDTIEYEKFTKHLRSKKQELLGRNNIKKEFLRRAPTSRAFAAAPLASPRGIRSRIAAHRTSHFLYPIDVLANNPNCNFVSFSQFICNICNKQIGSVY
jgi:hypothetical protein